MNMDSTNVISKSFNPFYTAKVNSLVCTLAPPVRCVLTCTESLLLVRFLVSKLENLKSKKANCDQIGYDSSQTESSPQSLPKTKGVKIKTVHKQGSKDEFELSAGSFTQDLETIPQP
ncbi:hypothetical protein L2E82_19421 [Cichorium intybus]|uniref:Uncharacterized protein n=1 Tax=Cichorium intybus TaxID=13427 RepID=A0ACB9FB56_CICIN|nr:hypothetical protein L2E82_19421 [Cichorium intybus]